IGLIEEHLRSLKIALQNKRARNVASLKSIAKLLMSLFLMRFLFPMYLTSDLSSINLFPTIRVMVSSLRTSFRETRNDLPLSSSLTVSGRVFQRGSIPKFCINLFLYRHPSLDLAKAEV